MNVGRGGILQIIEICIIRKCFLTFLEPKVFEKNGLSSWKSREKIENKQWSAIGDQYIRTFCFWWEKLKLKVPIWRSETTLWKLQSFLKLFPKVSNSTKRFFVFCAVRCYEWARNQWWPRVVLLCSQKRSWKHKTTTAWLVHVSSKFRVLRLTVTAWHESEIFQTRGIESVWTESSFSEHDGDLARGNSVLKIIQNSSEKQSDLPLTVTNWVSRLFFTVCELLNFASLEKTRTRFPLPPAKKLCPSSQFLFGSALNSVDQQPARLESADISFFWTEKL